MRGVWCFRSRFTCRVPFIDISLLLCSRRHFFLFLLFLLWFDLPLVASGGSAQTCIALPHRGVDKVWKEYLDWETVCSLMRARARGCVCGSVCLCVRACVHCTWLLSLLFCLTCCLSAEHEPSHCIKIHHRERACAFYCKVWFCAPVRWRGREGL